MGKAVATAPEPQDAQGGEIRKVPIRDLRLDSSYQRDLDMARVQKMVRDWDPRRSGLATLSHRAGVLWIVDGQHRVAALREMGAIFIDASVLEGMSQSDEADLFVALQRGTKSLNAWDLFKAETTAGHPEVLDIIRIVHAAGFKIERSTGHGNIQAVGALRRVFSLGGEPLLALTLTTARGCWSGDRKQLDGQVLEGLALFFHSFRGEPQYDADRASRVLQTTPAVTFLRQAQEIAQNRASVSSSAANVAEAIRNKYNDRLSRAKQLGAIRRIRRSPGR